MVLDLKKALLWWAGLFGDYPYSTG